MEEDKELTRFQLPSKYRTLGIFGQNEKINTLYGCNLTKRLVALDTETKVLWFTKFGKDYPRDLPISLISHELPVFEEKRDDIKEFAKKIEEIEALELIEFQTKIENIRKKCGNVSQ